MNYVNPAQQPKYPGGLSLEDFLQTVIVGLSQIPGPLVRPKWQAEPPKQPDITVNWIGMAVEVISKDFDAYVAPNADGVLGLTRNQDVQISLSIYGPAALETYDLIGDGFMIDQNRFALFNANIGYKDMGPARRVPDLVNERWVDRVETAVFLKREVQRTYPVPTIVSASGIIYVPDITPDFQLPWNVPA
jgi:hypothetical protein